MTEYYNRRIGELDGQIATLALRGDRLATGRLAAFLLLVLAVVVSIDRASPLWLGLAVATLGLFVWVLLADLRNRALLERARTLLAMLHNEVQTLLLAPGAYYNGSAFKDGEHPFSEDMDLFGAHSLFAYVNRCATGVGNLALANWLRMGSTPEQTGQRQQAVAELDAAWCEAFRCELFGRRIHDFASQHLPEIRNTTQPAAWYRYLLWGSRGVLLLSVAGVVAGGSALLLLLPIVVNTLVEIRTGRFSRQVRQQLEGREAILNEYARILSFLEKGQWQSPLLQSLQEAIAGQQGALPAIRQLRSLSLKLEYTLNMVMKVLLNTFFLWDLAICLRISGWFDRHAASTARWFEVAGMLEALVSLSVVQHNHPQWCWPVLKQGGFHLAARQLGHPLIDPAQRVCNDYAIDGQRFVHIVTGSNMAGKSTFLRSVGVNIILAQAGTVVCAQHMELSHFRIMSYLTITDSLAEHTSTFYREIKRLKKILHSARHDNNVLLLLDEMLRGTNSADKARGSMAITRELIRCHVPAIIATHNLELAAMEKEFPQAIANFFFDISISAEQQMQFDYKLKPGVCNTFNASLLLREIGIDIDP